jgi:predicted peptidase
MTGQKALTFAALSAPTQRLRYLLHLPQQWRPGMAQQWPLILFLHGIGQRGDDIEQVKKHGIARLVEERDDFPFITISPQCPPDSDWTPFMDTLIALVDEYVAAYGGDARRVYLTGLSMGGRGAWQLAGTHPRYFAAMAPICGRTPHVDGFLQSVHVLKHLPIWVFHGALDQRVPLSESEQLVAAVQACGGDIRLTIYPDAGHDSWTRTYDNAELYNWFLSHQKE